MDMHKVAVLRESVVWRKWEVAKTIHHLSSDKQFCIFHSSPLGLKQNRICS